MTYDELEAKLLGEYRQQFTEYYKGTSTPNGYIEPEWLVQADAEELRDWIRAALQETWQEAQRREQEKNTQPVGYARTECPFVSCPTRGECIQKDWCQQRQEEPTP